MIRLEVSESASPQWPAWIEEFDGQLYHSAEWAESRKEGQSRPLFFSWFDSEGRCVGIAVGIKSWSSLRYIGRLFRRLDFESYPAAQKGDADLTRLMIGQLVAFARREKYRTIAIQSYGAAVTLSDLNTFGLVPNSRTEFILDLTLSEEGQWKRLSTHHRRKIRKAQEAGLLLQEVSTLEGVRALRRLQGSSRDRRVRRGETLPLLEDAYYEEFGRQYFSRNLARLFLMMKEDRPVSAALITLYRGRALYVFGGSSEEGFAADAPALLFWQVFSRCRELGIREFNLGGVPGAAVDPGSQSHGLYRFKAGFGGKIVPCVSGVAENLNPGWECLIRLAKRMMKRRSPAGG